MSNRAEAKSSCRPCRYTDSTQLNRATGDLRRETTLGPRRPCFQQPGFTRTVSLEATVRLQAAPARISFSDELPRLVGLGVLVRRSLHFPFWSPDPELLHFGNQGGPF